MSAEVPTIRVVIQLTPAIVAKLEREQGALGLPSFTEIVRVACGFFCDDRAAGRGELLANFEGTRALRVFQAREASRPRLGEPSPTEEAPRPRRGRAPGAKRARRPPQR